MYRIDVLGYDLIGHANEHSRSDRRVLPPERPGATRISAEEVANSRSGIEKALAGDLVAGAFLERQSI